MPRKKQARVRRNPGPGTKDTWQGGEMVSCIRCGNKPGRREGCTLCKGEGKIKVRE